MGRLTRHIGLPQYRQVFEEEGVDDFLVLPFLRLSSLGLWPVAVSVQ